MIFSSSILLVEPDGFLNCLKIMNESAIVYWQLNGTSHSHNPARILYFIPVSEKYALRVIKKTFSGTIRRLRIFFLAGGAASRPLL